MTEERTDTRRLFHQMKTFFIALSLLIAIVAVGVWYYITGRLTDVENTD